MQCYTATLPKYPLMALSYHVFFLLSSKILSKAGTFSGDVVYSLKDIIATEEAFPFP